MQMFINLHFNYTLHYYPKTGQNMDILDKIGTYILAISRTMQSFMVQCSGSNIEMRSSQIFWGSISPIHETSAQALLYFNH
jgi:methylthioribose-1-phosphate isomerase